ncbi:M28 family peptidase [Mangrovimonas cancribranchiae]|uniref:M28 family peptidase n=1 Tax=Mangrovimonas cancribranchiae TaxID=3080055 RepID=A0AAU6P1L8_9FLAO
MKKALFLALGVLVFSCGTQKTKNTNNSKSQNETANATTFAETITSEELKDLLYVYASDEFAGRETGKPGQKKAIEFLKNQYIKMGISSGLPNNKYFQEVPLEVSQKPDASITVNNTDFTYINNFVSVMSSKTGNIKANDIVFAGYGIEDDSYSNYNNIDVKGKIVLIKSGEPKTEDGNYAISGNKEASKWSNLRQEFALKRDLAKEKGAKALLFYNPDIYQMAAARFGKASGRMSLKGNAESMYYFLINTDLAKALYPEISNATTSKTIKNIVNISYKNNSEEILSENVLAYIKGSEKPNELVIISAHLDHEGIKDGEIYNGADDDGSGTVSILEIAEAFKTASQNGMTPKRSILFLHVTGEEKGLLGSRYYTDFDPVFPLENTVANLNIDMIGRVDPKHEEAGVDNYLYLIGSDKLSTELHEISENINNKYIGMTFDYTYNDDNDPNRFYYRSDHYNFAKNNIPVIFYFNGTHADYHKPSDTVEKIRYDLLEQRTKLIYYTAWELVNRDDRIVVDKAFK